MLSVPKSLPKPGMYPRLALQVNGGPGFMRVDIFYQVTFALHGPVLGLPKGLHLKLTTVFGESDKK